MIKFNLAFSFLFFSYFIQAQQSPEIFQPGIISDGGVFGFTLSPDGREAFWVSSNGGRDTLVIMQSRLVKKQWQKPVAAEFSGKPGQWKDIDPVFTPDGKRLLFQSTRPWPGDSLESDFDIWAVDKVAGRWNDPYPLKDINTRVSESFASMASNGNVYFMKQNPDGRGSSDIYKSVWADGKYLPPVNIGLPVNTNFRESNPFISPSEDYLIYFTDDSTGLGDVDLVISFREGEGWGKPVSLGQPINSHLGEFCPFVHPGQERIYFSRTVVKPGGRRTENIYSWPFNSRKFLEASRIRGK